MEAWEGRRHRVDSTRTAVSGTVPTLRGLPVEFDRHSFPVPPQERRFLVDGDFASNRLRRREMNSSVVYVQVHGIAGTQRGSYLLKMRRRRFACEVTFFKFFRHDARLLLEAKRYGPPTRLDDRLSRAWDDRVAEAPR